MIAELDDRVALFAAHPTIDLEAAAPPDELRERAQTAGDPRRAGQQTRTLAVLGDAVARGA
ncbi:hypothetical protein BST41_11400 [Mycolicibacterium porcinum]|nr:hypothetical protein BST41_11400 [Mycolicibacterium porcinum]